VLQRAGGFRAWVVAVRGGFGFFGATRVRGGFGFCGAARRFDFSAVMGVVSAFSWAVVVRGGFGLFDAPPVRGGFVLCGATFDFSAVTKIVGDFRFALAGFLFLAFCGGLYFSGGRPRLLSLLLHDGGVLGGFCGAEGGLGTLDQLLACKAQVEYALFVRLGRATSGAWSVTSREGFDAGTASLGLHRGRDRDHPFASMQRLSNSPRLASATPASVPLEATSFEASN